MGVSNLSYNDEDGQGVLGVPKWTDKILKFVERQEGLDKNDKMTLAKVTCGPRDT